MVPRFYCFFSLISSLGGGLNETSKTHVFSTKLAKNFSSADGNLSENVFTEFWCVFFSGNPVKSRQQQPVSTVYLAWPSTKVQ